MTSQFTDVWHSLQTRDIRRLVDEILDAAGGVESSQVPSAVWETFCELGLDLIAVDEDAGGSGGELRDLLAVIDAVAFRGVGLPLVDAANGAWALTGAGQQAVHGLTLAVSSGALSSDGRTVRGTLRRVPWGREAFALYLHAEGRRTQLVVLDTLGVTIRRHTNLAGEPRDTVVLDHVAVFEPDHFHRSEAVELRGELLWASALRGAVHGAYALTHSYVATCEQFGAPLIRIEAVASAMATLRAELDQVDAAVDRAVLVWEAEDGERPGDCDLVEIRQAVAVARIVAARAATEMARTAHQLHGAMGSIAKYPLWNLTTRLLAWRDQGRGEHGWARAGRDGPSERASVVAGVVADRAQSGGARPASTETVLTKNVQYG